MSITTHRILTVFFLIAAIAAPINGSISRKLDESSVPGTPDTGIKCGGCSSCQNPCNQSPPPPPPLYSSPPPPSPPPPSPPQSPKKPPSKYCPPPPPPPASLLYVTGPPGDVYPVDPYFSGAGRNLIAGLPILIGCGLLGLLAFW